MKTHLKRIACLLIIASTAFLTTSCWDNRDLTKLAIAVGVGFDKTADNKVELTIQLVNPLAAKSEQGGSNNPQEAQINVTVYGKTVFEAIRNLISKVNQKVFFAHVQMIVIGESFAKGNLADFVDFFERAGHETNYRVKIVIAKGTSAKNIINSKSRLEKLSAIHISNSLSNSNANGEMEETALTDILKLAKAHGQCLTIGIIENSSEGTDKSLEDMNIQGTAIFDKGTLAGYLTPIETRGYLMSANKGIVPILAVQDPVEKDKFLSIELKKVKSELKAKVVDEKVNLSIKVFSEGLITEQQGTTDLTTDQELFQKAAEKTAEEIKKEVGEAVRTAQKYQCDIFGFIKYLYVNDYKSWEKLFPDWGKIFQETPVDIQVDFKLRRSGLILKPVNFKDPEAK